MNLKKAREAPAVRSEVSRGPLRGDATLEKAKTAFTKAKRYEESRTWLKKKKVYGSPGVQVYGVG